MSSLCRRLDELYEENQGCVILFTWIQFLKEQALDFLGIQSPLEVIKGGSKAGGERRKADPQATGTTCVRFRLPNELKSPPSHVPLEHFAEGSIRSSP